MIEVELHGGAAYAPTLEELIEACGGNFGGLELRNNDLILRDYGHLKYKRIDDPRPEPTLESDEDWQDELRAGQQSAHPVALPRAENPRRQASAIPTLPHHCRRR